MAKETVPNRRYTDEYKQEALRLAKSVGINQAAQRLGMPASSLGNWMRRKAQRQVADLIDWLEGFYNANRLHSSINYLSPTSFEKERKAA